MRLAHTDPGVSDPHAWKLSDKSPATWTLGRVHPVAHQTTGCVADGGVTYGDTILSFRPIPLLPALMRQT